MEEAGYEYEIKRTFGYPSLYTSGQVDVIFENPPMLARMAAEQDIESVQLGVNAKNPLMASVSADSPYRVSETGSPQNSIQQAAEDGSTFGITGWVTAATALHQMLYDEWGVTMTQDESDFEVVTTQFPAVTNLILEGDLDLGVNWPVHPGHCEAALSGPDIVPLFDYYDVQDELGFDAPLTLGGPATRAEKWEQDREGVVAFCQAMNEAS
jgi:ABC-type nitrate/sulfonate/bicarbonate transport system substrate-binding protein